MKSFRQSVAEVDDALKLAEQDVNPEIASDANKDDKEKIEVSERETKAFDSIALAVSKVERLVANDDAPKRSDTENEKQDDIDLEAVLADLEASTNVDENVNETPEEVIQELLAESQQEGTSEEPEASKSATPDQAATAVAERLKSIFEPEVLNLSEELKDTKPDISDEKDEISQRDAWNLSKELQDDDYDGNEETLVVKEGYGFAREAIPDDTKYIDDIEQSPITALETDEGQDIEGGQAGRRLWLSALIASLAVIVFGIVDFYNRARPGQTINQSTIAFGPLMIAIGGVVFVMAAYFLISRRRPQREDSA